MKQTKLILLAILLSLVESDLLAYSCKIDGICYNLNSTDHTAKVTYSGYPHNNEYTGSYGGGLKGVDVTIPSSITYNGIDYTVVAIGDYAFYDAESTVLMNSVSIPPTVTSIGKLAFQRCVNITSIVIPASVSTIGSAAFYQCTALQAVTMQGKTPVSITVDAFSNCTNAVLIVPRGSKDAYAAADNWKDFKLIVDAGGTETLKGDINGDGNVTALDASLILQYVAKKITW